MRIIGLTGGIACGKSTISLTLKSLGATIIDGDQLSRALTQPGGLALPAIRAEFGSEVFHADGTLDRRALGSLIFASNERRHALDDLMQPLLREMIEREILRAKEGGAKICVLDMPLLYEAELDGLCNTVWCASLPRETQLARLMARDGFTREEAENRLRSQMDTAERRRRANVVIPTDGTIEETAALIPPLTPPNLPRRVRMENTPRPRRSDRYQAQAAPSAQEAPPVTQHPLQPTRGYPPQSNSQNPPPSPVQQAMQPRSAAPAWLSASDRVLYAAAESASRANAARASGAGAVCGHESGVFAAAAAPHCPASDAIRRAAAGGVRPGGEPFIADDGGDERGAGG